MSALPATMGAWTLPPCMRSPPNERVRWERAGVSGEIVDGPLTDKPTAWLILRASSRQLRSYAQPGRRQEPADSSTNRRDVDAGFKVA
jgi:hypothetical protein